MPVLTDLNVQPALIANPLDTIGKIAALRGSQAETALRQAQTSQAGLETQNIAAQAEQRQRDLADQNLLQNSMGDPAIAKQVGSGNFSALEGKVQPKSLMSWRAANDAHVKDVNTNDAEGLKNALTKHKIVEDAFTGLLADPADPAKEADDATVTKGYSGLISRLIADGTIPPEIAQQLPSTVTSAKQVKQMLATNNYLAGVSEQLLGRQKIQAENAQKTAQAASEQATADLSTYKLNLMKGAGKGDPGARAASVKAMSIFANHPQEAQDAADAGEAAYQAALSSSDPTQAADKAAAAVKDVADRLRAFSPGIVQGEVAKQDALRPGQVKTASAEAAATEPIRARATADAQAYLMKQVGGPLAEVMDPAERTRIGSEYLKANDAYAEKAADADRLKQFVAAARTGNQSAAGLMTTAELRSIVNRVNTVELQKAGGASVVRRIENALDNAGEGIPSEETLKELEQVADLNNKTAAGSFAQKVRGIKVLSPKANLSETPIGAVASRPMIRARDPQGKLHEASAGTALPAGWKAE